jgi:hypothetical protein
MPSTGYWLEDSSKAAIKLIPSTNPYGKGTDVNVAGALFRFIPGGFAPSYNLVKIRNTEITGTLGTKTMESGSRGVTLPVKSYLHYQDDAIETIIATAMGQSTAPALITGSTYRYVFQVKQIIDRFFSAAIQGGITDSVYNPNGIFYYPTLIPNQVTIEGTMDEFVTVSADLVGWDELIPLGTTINKVGGITATDTTITVTSTAGFNNSGFLLLNRAGTAEIVFYRGLDGTNFYNVVRGLLGTTAAAHANGVTVETLCYTTANLNSATPINSPIASFDDVKFFISDASAGAFTGSDIIPIKHFVFQIQNNLKYDPDTGTFGRFSQPKRTSFQATLSVDEVTYREMVHRFRYIDNARLKAKIEMTSSTFTALADAKTYQCNIWLPAIQYSGDNPASGMFGSGLPEVTHSFECTVSTSIPTGFPSETTSIGIIEFVNLRSTNLIT